MISFLRSIWHYLSEGHESWKDAVAKAWDCWYVQDLIVLVFAAVMVCIIVQFSRKEYWRLAFGQVFRRRLARISFLILCLYTAIGLLDCIGYHPYLRDSEGAVRKAPGTEISLMSEDGLTVLDLLLTGLRETKEKTYSAPFATHQFTKVTSATPDGRLVRISPELEYGGIHALGTDKIGIDILYLSLKSIRTALLIGMVTTLIAIPFAMLFGIPAGYLGGWVDDVVQFIYTVLSSIPSVLLIAAFMSMFEQPGLLQLCFILGVTSWTGLCRTLRGESMKVREAEFVQAAKATGASTTRIMLRHIAPNIMHLALITAVLSFSGSVLVEAVLTYLGIGVGPNTASWGTMIYDALGELSRDPVIWWKLFAAFIFMLGLVLPANLFGDALRDALDPRLRTD